MKKFNKTSDPFHILFYQSGTMGNSRNSLPHQHDFWQMEIALGGSWAMQTAEGDLLLKANDIVLIQPGVIHGFTYPGNKERYCSIKFQQPPDDSLQKVFLPKRTDFTRAWINCLRALLDETEQQHIDLNLLQCLVRTLLVDIQRNQHLAAENSENNISRAQIYIKKHCGRAITVEEVARAVGVATNYLATIFPKATGVTVKQAIDQQRHRLCCDMLRYADLSISQIAAELDFSDIYSFSRFFKRMEGHSPRQFRDRSRQ